MAKLETVIQRGTRAAQPAATAVGIGTLYCVTDEGNLVERSSGTVWQAFGAARFSYAMYVFVPDAAPGAVVVAGNQQGHIGHSGPSAETADLLYVDAETAPGASGLPITVEYGDTNDLDTVATWTTVVTYTLSSEKSNQQSTMTNATIPANRLLRMNVGTIVGSPADVTVTLRAKRPLTA